jgi:HlyD family secretion protein
MRRVVKTLLILAAVLAVIAGAALWWGRGAREPQTVFRTAPVTRGDLVATINATGTVEPEEVVDVGAQVAGLIQAFGTDKRGKPIDYGSVVGVGTVLARIDATLYAADVDTAKAQVQQAQANQISAAANIEQMKAKLLQAQADWERAQRLGPSEALAPSAFDQYRANYEVAKANLAVAVAAVEQARATLVQAQAALGKAQQNLGYCTITSPVEGVIIDRRVNIGQTVVSSLSAPSLFLIAKDLTRIQVWASVNEADIGTIHPGQAVTFTVDAFPDRVFHGHVGKIRLNATMTQNVVTYTVEVNTDNADGTLLPYLTANAKFEAGRRHLVLQVPNAALRWIPQPGQIAPDLPRRSGGSAGAGREGNGSPPAGRGTLWIEQGTLVRPIAVTTGLTDGTQTEVSSPELGENQRVIVGEMTADVAGATAGQSGGTSPFLPQLRFGRQRAPGPAGSGGGPGTAPGTAPGAPGSGPAGRGDSQGGGPRKGAS